MTPLVLAAAIAAVTAYVLRARVHRALVAFIAVTLLVPVGILVPGVPSSYLNVHRLTLLALMLNVFVKVRHGDIPGDALRPTPLHLALFGYTVVSFVVGIALGDRLVPTSASLFLWVFIVDQFVTFTVVVAITRSLDDVWLVPAAVAVVATIAGIIAVFEHFTGESYGRFVLTSLADQSAGPGTVGLDTRGGDVRVRAATDFSLAYAWVATIALPVVAAVVARARRPLLLLAPGVVAASVLWTYARSAYAGAFATIAILLVASRLDRRILRMVVLGAAAAVLVAGPTAAYERTFRSREVTDSNARRATRAPVVLERAAELPFTGSGLASLAARGERSTDATYLQVYAELGIVGAVSFALLLLVALLQILPGLRAPPGPERTLAAAIVAALLAGIASAAFVDSFSVAALHRSFWILAAAGVALAERIDLAERRAPARVWPRVVLPIVLPLVGTGMGFFVFASSPSVGSHTFRFQTIAPRSEAVAQGGQDFIGRTFLNTACVAMEVEAARLPDTKVSCFDLRTQRGIGQVRIEAPPGVLDRRVRTVLLAGRAAGNRLGLMELSRVPRAKPTWARTAPVWGAAAGFAVALLLAALRRAFSPALTPVRLRAAA